MSLPRHIDIHEGKETIHLKVQTVLKYKSKKEEDLLFIFCGVDVCQLLDQAMEAWSNYTLFSNTKMWGSQDFLKTEFL